MVMSIIATVFTIILLSASAAGVSEENRRACYYADLTYDWSDCVYGYEGGKTKVSFQDSESVLVEHGSLIIRKNKSENTIQ